MTNSSTPRVWPVGGSTALPWLLFLAVMYTAYFARFLLIPIVLALVLSMVLAPVMRVLLRVRIPGAVAAAIIIFALMGAFAYGLYSLAAPASDWVQRAPSIMHQIEHKISPIKQTVQEVSAAAEQVESMTETKQTAPTVKLEGPSLRDIAYDHAKGFIVGTVSVLFLVYFLLAWGDRFVLHAQAWAHRRGVTRFNELFHVLQHEISHYLLTITIINTVLGLVVAGAMYLLDMPNPGLWGVLAGVLNFAPYLGALAVLIVITIVSLLTFPDIGTALLPPAVFFFLTTLEGQIITPQVVGQRLALNPLVVFLSIIFWFWLWGVIGALLAVPILAIVKIVSDRSERLQPLGQVLGR